MRITKTMQQHVDNGGWTAVGTTVALMVASSWVSQMATAVATAVITYTAVHFLKLLLNKYAPIEKGDKK